MLCFTACKTSSDFYNITAFTETGHLHAVIEIPAGTNMKYEFRKEKNDFHISKRNGMGRKIDFLPYPGNYGFIPFTYSDPEKGGDGDALDVLVLCEALETGKILEVIPLGMLKLIDEGEEDYKIIAVPATKQQQIIKAENFKEFSQNYPEVKQILEIWFNSYDKKDNIKIKGWEDEKAVIAEIKKSQQPSKPMLKKC